MNDFVFPYPLPEDSGDVAGAILSARIAWQSENIAEAVRCLRVASTAAGTAGNAPRSLHLAEIANGLEANPQQAQDAAPPVYTQAIRVAVKRSVRDGNLFVARLLDAEAAPRGTCEAFLVLTDPDVDLFDPFTHQVPR